MKCTVLFPIYPTEDINSIWDCFETFFQLDAIVKEISGLKHLEASSHEMDALAIIRNKVHDTRIIDTVRKRLVHNWNGSSTFLRIDKQAASVGRLRILDDAHENPPLGSILLELSFTNASEFEKFLHWFTPPTKDGKIVTS
ncbi:MAG: hypothetical protein BAJATHORv1_20470 [Candidatus Thorarchaeota archaeon]|nr:MAG: hypothetical protein BAJATHORv1_20470 [Candidatus Thorarchaeota archaeon]